MIIETKFSVGDRFRIDTSWIASCTAITYRTSGQIEYLLEWNGDGEFRSEWFTAERMTILGIKKRTCIMINNLICPIFVDISRRLIISGNSCGFPICLSCPKSRLEKDKYSYDDLLQCPLGTERISNKNRFNKTYAKFSLP